MRRMIAIILLIALCFLLAGCATDKYYEGHNGITYQKNHEYYYMSNEKFMKNYYHYDVWLK